MLALLYLIFGGLLAAQGLHAGIPPWHVSGYLLALFALAFEVSAVKLPFYGFFSCSPALLAAMCLDQGVGPQQAWMVLLAALALRTLFRGIGSWREASGDLLAQGLSLSVLTLLSPTGHLLALVPAGILYVSTWRAAGTAEVTRRPPSKGRTTWYNVKDWIWHHQLAVLFMAPVLALVVQSDPLYAIWTVPILGGIHRAVHAELIRLRLLNVEELEKQALQSQQALAEVASTLTVARKDLHLKAVRESVLWELSHGLSESQRVETTAAVAVNYVVKKLPCDSVAVIAVEEGKPVIKAEYPPGAVRVTRLLQSAWVDQKLVTSDNQTSPDDLPAIGQRHMIALPLGSEGVLYCGRTVGAYTPEELALLGAAAGQVTLGMQASRRLEEQQNVLTSLLHSAKTAAVGQMAAGLAHELNTPLAAIALQMDMALERRDNPQRVQERLQAAQRSLVAAQGILKRLLYYSREGAVLSDAIDLNQIVTDTVDFLSVGFAKDEIELSRDHQFLKTIQGNANQLQQALVNLLQNARTAVLDPAATSRTISVSTCMSGEKIQVIVRDQGVGIPVEIEDRIFEPFFTTQPVGQGVGLGLSIALKIVQNHGGTLLGRNNPKGPGAEFIMEL